MASSRAKPFFRRSEGSRGGLLDNAREIPRPAGESAGLRNDAAQVYGPKPLPVVGFPSDTRERAALYFLAKTFSTPVRPLVTLKVPSALPETLRYFPSQFSFTLAMWSSGTLWSWSASAA